MRGHLALLILPLLLGSCSRYVELSAIFIDGRLGFVAKNGGAVDCVHLLGVDDAETGELMWEAGDPGSGSCLSALPILYGQAVPRITQAAKPLKPGRSYQVSDSASDGTSLSGRFRISRALAWRVEDLKEEPTPFRTPEDLLANESNPQ